MPDSKYGKQTNSKKKFFEVGQLHVAVGSILYIHTSTKYIHLYAKCYLQQHEVGQLQKSFFQEFVYLSYFKSGILVTCNMLSENIIFGHWLKMGFWAKIGKMTKFSKKKINFLFIKTVYQKIKATTFQDVYKGKRKSKKIFIITRF